MDNQYKTVANVKTVKFQSKTNVFPAKEKNTFLWLMGFVQKNVEKASRFQTCCNVMMEIQIILMVVIKIA